MARNKSLLRTSWWPLMLISQLLGLTFYTKKIPTFLTILYKAFVLIVLAGILIDQLPVIVFWTSRQKNPTAEILQIMKITTAWINYFIDFAATAFRNGEIRDTLRDLLQLDLELPDEARGRIRSWQIVRFILNFLSLLVFQISSVPLSPPEIRKAHSSTMYVFIDSLMLVVVMQYVEFMLLVREYYKCFSSRIEKLRDQLREGCAKPRSAEEEIGRFQVLHFALHDICDRWTRLYQAQLFLVLIRCFIEATTVTGSMVIEEERKDSVLLLACRTLQAVYNLGLIAQICSSCQSTVDECKGIVVNISSLANSTGDEGIREEIRLLLMQTWRFPLHHTVFGFVRLNAKLITKVLTSIMSYCIIIYTFKTSRRD